MNLVEINRIEMMRNRQAYFPAVARNIPRLLISYYWFAIMGIQLTEYEDRLERYIQLDFTEYEQYYVIKTPEGNLSVSYVIQWQDNYCCNSLLNIMTGERSNEEDIFICYQ